MIKPKEIQQKAREVGVRDQQIEKDYMFSWILSGIAWTNAMQYARTSKITLDITFVDARLVLIYNDDGPGFDKEAVTSKGAGLNNILERVTLINGKVELDSRPGFGSDYSISIPLNELKKT
jgi:signal transduction histidine kinase